MTTPRKPGRPATGKGAPVRLDPATTAELVEIARREGLTHAGQPSVSKAVAWALARLRQIDPRGQQNL